MLQRHLFYLLLTPLFVTPACIPREPSHSIMPSNVVEHFAFFTVSRRHHPCNIYTHKQARLTAWRHMTTWRLWRLPRCTRRRNEKWSQEGKKWANKGDGCRLSAVIMQGRHRPSNKVPCTDWLGGNNKSLVDKMQEGKGHINNNPVGLVGTTVT